MVLKEKQFTTKLFFWMLVLLRRTFFDHLLWSIFQSSFYTYYNLSHVGPLWAAFMYCIYTWYRSCTGYVHYTYAWPWWLLWFHVVTQSSAFIHHGPCKAIMPSHAGAIKTLYHAIIIHSINWFETYNIVFLVFYLISFGFCWICK